MKKLSRYKFANEDIEIKLIKFWINANPKQIIEFKKMINSIPISAIEGGIFWHGWKKR